MDFSAGYEYAKALEDVLGGWRALKPPKRVSVSQGATKHLIIAQTGGTTANWSAEETPYMVEPMDMLASRKHEAVIFVGPARTGKCLALDTRIPTPSGWTTMGTLREGDIVLGDDGLPTKVLQAHDVKHGLDCYKVVFADGTSVVADAEHQWGVERFYWNAPQWRYEVRSTREMLRELTYSPRAGGGSRFRFRVKNTEPLQLPQAPLAIDPYVLGVWLGNGSASCAIIHSNREDVEFFELQLSSLGFTHRRAASDPDTATVIDPISDKPDCLFGTMSQKLRTLGLLGNKHVPAEYLRASFNQRVALLQGLMDTDGYVDPRGGRCEFSTVLPTLADNMLELLRSLGLKPSVEHKDTTWVYKENRHHGKAFRISFSVHNEVIPFRSPRKLINFRRSDVGVVGYRQIVAIEPVESVPVRCIYVDNESHLFLAGEGMVPTHNTESLITGWLANCVVNDPGDFAIFHMSQEKAREFSKVTIDRALRHSKDLKALMSASAHADNTHDKLFSHGMWLRIAWPTVSNMSGATYRYTALTDYDRMPDDIDGEGAAFFLALKRVQTFLSRGMAMAESSPGRDITDPFWTPATPHEGPPVGGIIGLYNSSDRRRLYWQCQDCYERFEASPGLSLFNLPSEDELIENIRTIDIEGMAKQYARVVCPHCGSIHMPKQKRMLNKDAVWLADGLTMDRFGEVHGTARSSKFAGYWLGGVAAAFQTWQSIISRYLNALHQYSLSGMEEALKNTFNVDQGVPYISRHLVEAARTESKPVDRAKADMERFVVPAWTRYVQASVDVQGGSKARFDVQVHAFGPHGEQALVNRFAIRDSRREGIGQQWAPIDPAGYPEDWDRITEEVVRSTYRTPLEGKEIRVRMVVVDSGGEDGVTANAYEWMRRCRRAGLSNRVMLYKGLPGRSGKTKVLTPLIRESMLGGRNRNEKGDVPVYVCNSDMLADTVSNNLKRSTPGPGYYHFPVPKGPSNPDGWLPQTFFDEMQAEVRNANGSWSQVKPRNETWDHLKMQWAAYLRLGCDKIKDWTTVPDWLAPLEHNAEVITSEQRRVMKETPIAQVVRPVRERRVVHSPYLK